jgi:hypothetical protein
MQYSGTQTAPSGPTSPLPISSSLIDSAGVSDDNGHGIPNPFRILQNKRQEADLVRYLDSLYERARRARWRFERQWFVNLSFYFGRQWITWLAGGAPDYARLYEPQAPPWRVRLVVNRIKPAIRREMSKVMKEKPTAYVIPSTTDDSDIAAARAGEAIFEHLWRTLKVKDHMWNAQFWRAITGTGFVKDWWDPKADMGLGNIGIEVPTPFHLFFANLDQVDIERQEFIIHQAMKSPDEVETVFGVKLKPDSIERGGGVIEAQLLQALNLEPGQVSQVCVKEIWIKPNVRFPRGAMFVWAGGKMLFSSADPMTGDPRWPLYKMEYPFTDFKGVPTGRFYGDSSIIDLLPIQKEYNRTRSQIIEAKNQMSKPQLMAPRGSVDASKITSEPGLVIFYKPGYERPTPVPLSGLPEYVLQELDRSLLDMADISGQHEVSTGTVPQGVTAASALSFLQESDDTMIAPIISSLESGIERMGRHFLCHVHERWDEPRLVKVLGPDNTWEAKEFSRLDLRENTDLNVEAGSAMPRSMAAKQALILELMKERAITPEEGLRHLEMAATRQLYEELQLDRRQAERENMKMSDPATAQPARLASMFQGLLSNLNLGQDASAGGMLPGSPAPGGGPGMAAAPGTPALPPPGGGLEDQGVPAGPVAPMGGGGMPGPQMPPPGDMPLVGGSPMDMDPTQGGQPGNAYTGALTPDMIYPPDHQLPIVPVNTWDNHQTHIEVHNNYRKRQEFENLSEELKQEFERHVELHRAMLGLPPTINPEQMLQIQQIAAANPQLGAGGPAPGSEQGGMPGEEGGATTPASAPVSESAAPTGQPGEAEQGGGTPL